MILTSKNIEKWKLRLSRKMKDRYNIEDYAFCKTDSEWLEDYEGASEEDAIEDEIQYWD